MTLGKLSHGSVPRFPGEVGLTAVRTHSSVCSNSSIPRCCYCWPQANEVSAKLKTWACWDLEVMREGGGSGEGRAEHEQVAGEEGVEVEGGRSRFTCFYHSLSRTLCCPCPCQGSSEIRGLSGLPGRTRQTLPLTKSPGTHAEPAHAWAPTPAG